MCCLCTGGCRCGKMLPLSLDVLIISQGSKCTCFNLSQSNVTHYPKGLELHFAVVNYLHIAYIFMSTSAINWNLCWWEFTLCTIKLHCSKVKSKGILNLLYLKRCMLLHDCMHIQYLLCYIICFLFFYAITWLLTTWTHLNACVHYLNITVFHFSWNQVRREQCCFDRIFSNLLMFKSTHGHLVNMEKSSS